MPLTVESVSRTQHVRRCRLRIQDVRDQRNRRLDKFLVDESKNKVLDGTHACFSLRIRGENVARIAVGGHLIRPCGLKNNGAAQDLSTENVDKLWITQLCVGETSHKCSCQRTAQSSGSDLIWVLSGYELQKLSPGWDSSAEL